jgi:hypothetical protein
LFFLRVEQAEKYTSVKTGDKLSEAVCFHGVRVLGLFDPEDGSDIFLRNVC